MLPLWITYAWIDNAEGNFDYLVQSLSAVGVTAAYDKVTLIPGRALWEQIGNKITNDSLSGWAYLLTPNSISSAACREELSYALQRTLEAKGSDFPLIGLLHNVSIQDVPISLRIRLCVNLANLEWVEEIKAGVEARPPARNLVHRSALILEQHKNYLGNAGQTAIEIRPRFGEIRYWRFGFPIAGPQPRYWGHGPANGGGTSPTPSALIDGTLPDILGFNMRVVGGADVLTPSTSAYAVFDSALPACFCFGRASQALTLMESAELIQLNDKVA